MNDVPLVDLAPLVRLLALAALLALLPLAWVWLRARRADARTRLATLTALTLFLTFDLIVFGSFTRLSDSGLGCPDWPGCYGEASPFGAHEEIRAAQAALPSGPVTFTKAWIEMIHRYLAMTVGALILVMAVFAWVQGRRAQAVPRPDGERALPLSPWWPTATLAWVIVQGLFGKYTVTLKLYPAVVTLHLLGGLALLVLLAIQHEAFRRRPLALAPAVRRAAIAVAVLLGVQIALGGWVSTNYAVLACTGFPQCNGHWWPEMDFAGGFAVLRHLGQAADGGYLAFEALVAIHMAHRVAAVLVVGALLWLAWRLRASGSPVLGRFGLGIAALAVLQVLSGLSNVVLGWPIAAALAHSAGAAGLVLLLALLLARTTPRLLPAPAPRALAAAA
jgi:cytochrome c oxidase assembly protein subunit 15